MMDDTDRQKTIEISKKLVGLSLKEALGIIQENNLLHRVVAIGDETFVCTADYRTDRVNLRLSDQGLKFTISKRTFDLGEGETTVIESKKYENKEDGIITAADVG